MSRDSSDFWPRTIALLLVLAVAVTYFEWASIVRLTADATRDDVALWIYDTDAARGGSIDAHVRIDKGERVRIVSIEVDGAGKPQVFGGDGRFWGSTITRGRIPSDASASADFTIRLPDTASDVAHLSIHVRSIAAVDWGMKNFTNETDTTTFEHDVTLHSSTARLVRRLLRVAIALAAAAVALWLLLRLNRRYERRDRVPPAVVALLVPFALVGHVLFWPLLSAGLNLHGFLFWLVCTLGWWSILALPGLQPRFVRLRRYQITSAWVATDASGGDAYRSAASPFRMVPTSELEDAWSKAGLVVLRRRRWLQLSRDGRLVARVRVPGTDAFGDRPFEIRADQRATVERMMAAAAPLLGELRGHTAGEPELRPPERPTS